MSGQVTRNEIRNVHGEVIAVRAREDAPAGTQVWWENPDGSPGLPNGVSTSELPLFGSELFTSIPSNEDLVVTEGVENALALRAGGVQALATITGAGPSHMPRALVQVAKYQKFLLWPNNDDDGLRHMQALARNLYVAGALEVRIIRYRPGAGAEWPNGAGAADLVTPETARTLVHWLNEGWAEHARRPSAAQLTTARTIMWVRPADAAISAAHDSTVEASDAG